MIYLGLAALLAVTCWLLDDGPHDVDERAPDIQAFRREFHMRAVKREQ